MRLFGERVLAGALDLLLLGGIDAAVVCFTVRLADLPFAAACSISVAPLGVGFAGMLLGSRRALHDLLADTRVVRAQ